MIISKELLLQKILEFVVAVYDCRTNTPFVQDRKLYADDLVIATGWMVDLYKGKKPNDVAITIIDPSTSKMFDYWKQGEWGDKECEAFEFLKQSIIDILNI